MISPPISPHAQLGSVRTDAEFVWVLDPIDGTKSFITGKPLFGTLIGLCQHGVPTIGVIDQCVLKERWVGIRNVRTALNGEPVRATGCAKLADAMLYATTPHMFAVGEEADAFGRVAGSDFSGFLLVGRRFSLENVTTLVYP